jgi:hypothetical protein
VQRLHAPSSAVRRDAFAEALAASPEPPPALLAHAARDESALVRREAALAAGRARLFPFVRDALRDASPLVREAACTALAVAEARGAAEHVAALLRAPDPDARVRAAAARALARLAPGEPAAAEVLLEAVAGEDRALADVALSAAALLDRAVLAPAWARAVTARVARDDAEPDRVALTRLYQAWRRLTGRDAGYEGDESPARVREIVARVAPASSGAAEAPRAVR